ncbi:MAG: hypothetical protein HFJ05_09500 [Eubacterium sp.]|nr:hypothetical protein [Eubacterium sp.]
MKDMIDERNFREKCAKSIVKWYNVRYTVPEETAEKPAEAEEEVQADPTSKGVLDDESRWAHIPSAGYGKMKDNDPVTQEQIRQILGQQKNSSFEELLDENGEKVTE